MDVVSYPQCLSSSGYSYDLYPEGHTYSNAYHPQSAMVYDPHFGQATNASPYSLSSSQEAIDAYNLEQQQQQPDGEGEVPKPSKLKNSGSKLKMMMHRVGKHLW